MSESLSLTIFTDGGSRSNPGPAAIGVTIHDQNNVIVHEISEYLGIATNNEAEYDAILVSLTWLKEFVTTHKVNNVTWKLDSKLVVEQISRHWKIKEDRLRQKAVAAWKILDELSFPYQMQHVLRHLNKRADELVNQALDAQATT